MGCTASVPRHKPAGVGESTSDDVESNTASSLHKLHELALEVQLLPKAIARSFVDLRGFNADRLVAANSRPLSLLSFITLREVAAEVGYGYEVLPSLLGTLSRCIRKQGAAARMQKLQTIQFLHTQLQPGGGLARLRAQQPVAVVALCLSALTYDATRLSKPVKRGSTASFTARSASVSRHRSTAQGQVVRQFLLSTAYVRAWPEAERSRLLSLVGQINGAVGNPATLGNMLENEPLLLMSDHDLILLQTTLMVASNSHILRTFKTQTVWCDLMFEKLRGTSVSLDEEAKFCFSPGDAASQRFARSHSWVLRHVVLPFVALWARVAAVPGAQELCGAVSRLAGSYEMLCVDRSKSKADIHSSVPLRVATQKNSSILNVKSPLVDSNRDEVEIPYDSTAMLSVCKMYGVNVDCLLFTRRTAKEPLPGSNSMLSSSRLGGMIPLKERRNTAAGRLGVNLILE